MQLTYRGHHYSVAPDTSPSSEHITRMRYRGMQYSSSLSVPESSRAISSYWLMYRGVGYWHPF